MRKLSQTTANNLPDRQFLLLAMLIVLSGLVLRLLHLDFSYSNDELSALSRVRFTSFSDLVNKGFYVDGHPGGIQVFLYYWVKLAGMNEWAVRLPFALAGALGIWIAIKLFTRWFGQAAGLFSGVFIAFLAFPLLYSQIARPYGIGMTFCMIMVWYWTKLLFDKKPRILIAFAYALSAAACMYTHYFSFLLALITGLSGLFLMKKDRVYHYTGAGALAALLFSPHIAITLNHLSIGGVGLWLAKPAWNWPLLHIASVFNNSLLIAGLVVLIIIIQARYYKSQPEIRIFRALSLLYFILPMITGFIYSRWINPVLQDSVLIFAFPFFLGFLFSFSAGIPKRLVLVMTSLLLIAGISQTVFINNYYSRQHFGEFRGVARAICSWNQTYGPDNITRAISVNNPWYIEFYMKQENACETTFSQYDNRGGSDLEALKKILDNADTPLFAYAWTKPVPPEIRDMILARFPCIVETRNFSGLSDATLFAGKNHSSCKNGETKTLFTSSLQTENQDSGSFPEFFPGYEGRLNELPYDSADQLVATVEARTKEQLSGALLVASFHEDDGETLLWTASKFDLFTLADSISTVRLTIPVQENDLYHKKMKIYVWNPQKTELEIRSLTIFTEPFPEHSGTTANPTRK
jgi:hypothetical protein